MSYKLLAILFLSLFLFNNVYAKPVVTKYKSWNALQFSGKFSTNQSYLYDLELHGRFGSGSKTTIIRTGLGYAFNNSSLFIGFDYLPAAEFSAKSYQEYRPWQQFQWHQNLANFKWVLRSRLEERFNSDASAVSIRLRQRVTLQSANPMLWKFFPIIYDEVFINLNHVQWVATNTFNQNRAFLGFNIPFQLFTLQLGYLNQMEFKTNQRDISHILWLALKF